jgi:opacity protein-like surface antigen
MTRICAASSLAVFAMAGAAAAQDSTATYQQQKAFRFTGDTLARYEWTKDIPGDVPDVNRYRLQARPRVEMTIGPVQLGVGGEFNYSDDENDKAPAGETLTIIRDNYRSRDARLDLAWGKVTFGPFSAEGGRFFMPIPFTEMIWDRDLRPQGGAASIQLGKATSAARFALHGIYALGSHVFDDEGDFRKTSSDGSDPLLDQGAVRMYGGAGELSLGRAGETALHFMGAYLEFDKLNQLEPPIRRQNTRASGLIVNQYKVVDLVGRLTRGGQLPAQLVFDYCWNNAINADNKGLWLAAVLGEIGVSPAKLEYTYAKVDRDATVAAYNTDDFFWGTGWEGHRVDIGVSTRKNNSVHAIAQWQRFKDSPDPVVQQQWVKRYRLEWRTTF